MSYLSPEASQVHTCLGRPFLAHCEPTLSFALYHYACGMVAYTNWFDSVVRGAPGQSPSGPIVRGEKLPYGLKIVTEIYGVIIRSSRGRNAYLDRKYFPFHSGSPHSLPIVV